MSTEVVILGFGIAKTTAFNSAGFLGGLFPCFFDLITRQKAPPTEKIDLNKEFWLVKALLIPLGALLMTALAVGFGSITTWISALYLGASLPILVEKIIGASSETVDKLQNDQ